MNPHLQKNRIFLQSEAQVSERLGPQAYMSCSGFRV